VTIRSTFLKALDEKVMDQMKFRPSPKSASALVGALLLSLFVIACSDNNASPEASSNGHANHAVSSPEPSAFHDGMRMLWEDHVTWTRLAIVSLATDLPDTNATVERLLQNQVDIGNAVKPYYGDAAGEQLTALLKDHILVAAEIINAAKTGDIQAVDAAKARWYVNGDDIGAFLSSANPGVWSDAEMKSMMREHLDLTLSSAVNYLTGDYPASVADYDEIHRQILHMADMLSDGIVSQFPERFAVSR
jgi:hypothetical protein